jgi:short subunit dehydrogenase-like uncharacterized protein
LAEAARVLARGAEGVEGGFEGGTLTPAMLGSGFVERLAAAGIVMEAGLGDPAWD